MEKLTEQTQALNDKMQLMMEQLVLSKKDRFGRSSEKMCDPGQICFMEVDGTIVFFNEAEAVCDFTAPEPDDLELKVPKKKKQAGKKAADIESLPVRRIDHYMSEDELTAEFGENGWKQLPDAVSRCYKFIPASVEVEEHHIEYYGADGLTGIKEAIAAAFPKTEYQRCIVHQVRNTLKYVPDKDRKVFATDLKTIYQAADEKKALAALDRVTEKWAPKYPNSMKRWKDNWDAISPILKFSATVRKVIYTTNAIESLNSTYRKLNRQRSVFPSDTALLKALYLATFEATKKWTSTIRNWAQVYGELSIMYEGRLPE